MRIGGSPDAPRGRRCTRKARPCRAMAIHATRSPNDSFHDCLLRAAFTRRAARRALVIDDEIVGHRRSPDVERILGRIVARGPFDVGRNEVDVVRIFGEAAPGIAHVTEIIRADHMAAHAPAMRIPAVGHLLHAEPDLVDARDVPARMMQTRAVRLRERQHVVVTGMRAVQERDDVPRTIGQPQAQRLGVEAHRARHVGAEEQDVRKAPRAHDAGGRADRRGAAARRDDGCAGDALRRRRHLGRDRPFAPSVPSGSRSPDALLVRQSGAAAAGSERRALGAPCIGVDILGVEAEAHVLELFRSFAPVDRRPSDGDARRVEIDASLATPHVEPNAA